ncbi:MAG: ABC transporter substrate-binding protein, partial [Planctomycetota bacterium]
MTHLRTFLLLLVAMLPVCCTDSAPAKLRIGLSAWPGYLDLAVADEQGFFAAEGLDVQLVEFASLHEIARAYQLGQIDVMTGTLIEVLQVSHGARPVEIAWVVDVSNGADVAVARGRQGDLPSSGGATTLRDARIAYEPNSLGAYMLERMLAHTGLTQDDVEPVGMDQLEMVDAMLEQRIDVAITYPPTSIALLNLPHTKVIFSSAQIPDEVIDVISIDPTLLDADPTLLDRFYAAMARAETHVADDPES